VNTASPSPSLRGDREAGGRTPGHVGHCTRFPEHRLPRCGSRSHYGHPSMRRRRRRLRPQGSGFRGGLVMGRADRRYVPTRAAASRRARGRPHGETAQPWRYTSVMSGSEARTLCWWRRPEGCYHQIDVIGDHHNAPGRNRYSRPPAAFAEFRVLTPRTPPRRTENVTRASRGLRRGGESPRKNTADAGADRPTTRRPRDHTAEAGQWEIEVTDGDVR